MPIKKDATGKRWVEMELVVPGTPEQVWQALATGPGNAAWFVKAEIEPQVGGALRFDFGEGVVSAGQVTAWEPPRCFGYVERDWEPNAPPIATEITVTGRSGDRCVVRMVHSFFAATDDWDDQVEGFENGWPGFFAVLRLYLSRFAGQAGSSFVAGTAVSADALATWRRLGEAFGLTAASVGERRTAALGPENWSGTVEHIYQDATQRYLVLLLEAPVAGAVLLGCYSRAGTNRVSLCRFFWGQGVDAAAAESEPRWREFLKDTFAGPSAPEPAA